MNCTTLETIEVYSMLDIDEYKFVTFLKAIVTTRERANDSLTTRESVLSPRKVRVCDAAGAFLMELGLL
uniref:LisH domain-containing protein n=1 Tax=Panagrellus redivivus TaxID=6233 RepID=A0A7E4VCQ3_PANRE